MQNPFKKPEVEFDGQSFMQPKFILAVIVGHERKAPGATLHKSQGSVPEYVYNSAVAARMRQYGMTKNVDVRIIFRDGIGISGANRKAAALRPDACIELHFNSFNQQAHGSETLCSIESHDVSFAKIVQAKMCQVFDRQGLSRGVKIIPRSARGGASVTGLPGVANCLVEPFFGDNPTEAAMAVGRKDLYSEALVNAFAEWINK
jgi:N-acetylmuramoyl-L-alanine amidase